MKKYGVGIALIALLSINSTSLNAAASQEKAISNFDNLPNLTIAEKAATATKASLLPVAMALHIKQLLKAVMYLDSRLRKLEEEKGISAPILKKVTSVRDALKSITSSTTSSASASTSSAQELDQE